MSTEPLACPEETYLFSVPTKSEKPATPALSPFPDDPRRTLDDLISRAIAYRTGPEVQAFLSFAAKFPYLAPYNAMLLHIQNPGIRFALRAAQWQKSYKRRIRPAARPYVILRTMGPVEFVFDLSDTEPIDPTDDRVPMRAVDPFATKGEPPFGTLALMTHKCLELDMEVVTQDLAGTLAGQVIRDTKRTNQYLIRLNSKHTEAQKIGTLAHEIAHVLCGHLGPDEKNKLPVRGALTKKTKEFEAEAVAYLVTDRLSLDIGSVAYLSGYLAPESLAPDYSLDVVLKVAGKIELMLIGGRRPEKDKYLKATTAGPLWMCPEQEPLPAENIPKILEVFTQHGDNLFHTPEEFAGVMENLMGWKIRAYMAAAWNVYKATRPHIIGDPDWNAIFRQIDDAPSAVSKGSFSAAVTATDKVVLEAMADQIEGQEAAPLVSKVFYEKTIPQDQFMEIMGVVETWMNEGVDSPAKLAAKLLTHADGQLTSYSQRIWCAYKASGAEGEWEQDWAGVYSTLDA